MRLVSTNPSRNYEVLGEVEAWTEEAISDAVAGARVAAEKWAALPQQERSRAIGSFLAVCEENAEELARLMAAEMGKPITASRGNVQEGLVYFRAYLDLAERALAPEVVFEDDTQRHHLVREPLGVLACITPWNFPFFNIAWQAGQALIAGNTVLYKPSEEIVLFGAFLSRLVQASVLPAGVFTVVLGDGATGEALVRQPVDAVLFTGSTRTGRRITEVAAQNSTRVLTELGGSAPGIVLDDADLPAVIDTLYGMRFTNTGQFCDGLKRLLVHESRLEEVLEALKKVNAGKRVGDALEEATDLGPLVSRRQLETLRGQVQDALDHGAEVVMGGGQPGGLHGAYFEPTVLTRITRGMRVWREEVFGPVLPVMTFATDEEALHLANDTEYGLGGFVFTRDKERYLHFASRLRTGVVAHNNALYFSPASPFGGYKASGNSRTGGVAGFHEVTQIKLISEEK